MEEGYQLIQSNGRSADVNAALVDMTQMSRRDFLAQEDPFFYLDPDGNKRAHEFVELVRSGERGMRSGFDARVKDCYDGGADISVRLGAIDSQERPGELITVMIVPRYEVARGSEGDAEELAAYVSGAAHNMNNLLTGVTTGLSVFDGHMSEASTIQREEMLQTIKESANKAVELTSELLELAKVKQGFGQRYPIEVRSIVQEVFRIASSMPGGESFEFVVQGGPKPVMALADDSGLHQVLMNLVTNAMDASDVGGKIVIKLLSHDSLQGEMVAIVVQDFGAGMTHEVKARMFDPYFSTKKDSTNNRSGTLGGSGLGLASVLALVRSWGGQIECGSDIGLGTSFTISLQAANSPIEQQELRS